MNNKVLFRSVFVSIFVIILSSGCGPGQLFGPTLQPTETAIPTSTISGRALRHDSTPVINITVTLAKDIDGKDVIAETQTDADGYFIFENVAPGFLYLIGAQKEGGVLCTTAQGVEIFARIPAVADLIFNCL